MTRSFIPALLAESLGSGAIMAEVFFKTARSLRCEIGPLGPRSLELRRESGVALRTWDARGREGFVHSDGAAGLDPVVVAGAAIDAAAFHPGGPIPRLPGKGVGSPGDLRARAGAGRIARREKTGRVPGGAGSADPDAGLVRDFSQRLIAGFAARGSILAAGWVETGWTEVRILNTRGGEAIGSLPIASVMALAGSPGTGRTASRHELLANSLEALDPEEVVHEALRKAAAPSKGKPVSAEEIPVLLEACASAAWIRSLLPLFFTTGRGGAAFERGGGLDLVDDPDSAFAIPHLSFDGEGRPLRRRVLLERGEPWETIADSRSPDIPESDLGPMRRDSYRDAPTPGPIHLLVQPGTGSPGDLLSDLGRGLLVSALSPRSEPGSDRLVAEVSGYWIERGKPRHPVARTLMVIPALEATARVVACASDLEVGPGDPPIGAPSLLLRSADLVAM